jgi:hypothetical protein
MKIIYKIKFTVQQSAKLFLRNVEGAIIDSPFGNLLARLYDQRYTNFISDQDIRTAVKALITDGETLTITDETYGAIPYIPTNDPLSIKFYQPGGIESTVNIDVELSEFDQYGRPMALVAYKRTILFVGTLLPSAKLMYSLAELRGVVDPDDTVQTVDIYTASHSDSLTRLFIKLLGTAYYYGTKSTDTIGVHDMEKPKEAEDVQTSIPNHLLHGHDEDPVIHPPVARKAADTFTPTPVGNPDFQAELDFIRGDKVDDLESVVTTSAPGEPLEVTIPELTKVEDKPMAYPIKHEQVYRTAALAMAKLDLTAVIKAQRIIFPESEYWKEITRAKLYEVLMDELMKECDWEVGMIDQGNGPFLDHNPHPLGDDHEKFPFLIHSFVSQDPSSHKQTYKFTISYLPLSTVEELEIKK